MFDTSCDVTIYLPMCRGSLVQEVSGEEMARRKESWKIPAERQKVKGLLGKYRKSVSSAHIGAVTF